MENHLLTLSADSSTLVVPKKLKKPKKQLTNAEKERRRLRRNETARARYAANPDKYREESRAKYYRLKGKKTDEEMKAHYRKKNRLTKSREERLKIEDPAAYEAMRAARSRRKHEEYLRRRENWTDADRKRNNENAKRSRLIKAATMTEEERRAKNDERNRKRSEKIAAMTPQELEDYRAKRRKACITSYHRRKNIRKYAKQYKVA